MESKIKSNYKISELAEEDLLAIFLSGMENFGIKRAKQYYLAIEDVFNQLANFLIWVNHEMNYFQEL